MKKLCALLLAAVMILSCVSFAAAEESKTYKIGILQLVTHDALDAATRGFKETLISLLGEENLVFDEQNANGESATCTAIATSFANNQYDLLMANATPAVQACAAATQTIPVVGTSVTDYATALGDSEMDLSNGTGTNVTGASDFLEGRLYAEMVMELVPAAKKVSVLYCAAEPNSVVQGESFIAAMQEIAPEVAVTVFAFSDSNDLQSVVTAAAADADALYIPTDNTAASNMTVIANVTIPANLPVITGEENMMLAGGMATVSLDYYTVGVMAGQLAYQILAEGADAGALPIAYTDIATVKKEYNPDYAAAIGFEIPADYAVPAGYTAE